MNAPFDWRRYDRRLFATVAVIFPLIVLAGFARTYYLKAVFGGAPLPGLLVHLHGALMTIWVGYFISQVWLIRTKNHKVHMNMGMLGIALAILILVVGLMTAASSAKYGSQSTPPNVEPLRFLAVPVVDLVVFAALFGAAIWYKGRPADHKRLMLLTVLNFLPPAVARIPVLSLQALGPLFFFGVPTIFAFVLIILDTWKNKRLNTVFLIGTIALVASYPLRIMLAGTDAWMGFATWMTSLVP